MKTQVAWRWSLGVSGPRGRTRGGALPAKRLSGNKTPGPRVEWACVWLASSSLLGRQALSMGLSRQECWSGLPCPPPGDIPDPGIYRLRRPRPRQLRAFFSCMAWRAISGPLSKRKRRLDSLEAAQGAPRDPRRDSRGERSPWLPLETRPDSPGESGMETRDLCLPLRGILGPGHTPR